MLVQRQGMLLVVGGLAIGVVGGLLLTRLMKSLLFHVAPSDPFTFGGGRDHAGGGNGSTRAALRAGK